MCVCRCSKTDEINERVFLEAHVCSQVTLLGVACDCFSVSPACC